MGKWGSLRKWLEDDETTIRQDGSFDGSPFRRLLVLRRVALQLCLEGSLWFEIHFDRISVRNETAELRAWSRASCTRSRRPCGSFIDWQSASFRGCKTTENKKMMTWKPSEFWYEFLYFKLKLRSFSVVFWAKQKGIFKKILSKCSASPYFSQLSQIELSCQSVKQSVHCHSVPWQIAMATCVLVLRDASTQWHTLKNTS